MLRLKKIVSMLLLLCLTAGCFALTEPEKAEAAFDAGDGTVYVYDLDNDYKDGKYRIREKIVYKLDDRAYYKYGLTVTNQYLANSAGKKVMSWNKWQILEGGGTKEANYCVDFSTLPSDTYTLYFTITAEKNDKTVTYKRSIKHSAGKISYSSGVYTTDTNGTRVLKVIFNIRMLKGYVPKLEVFNSKGKVVHTYSGSKVAYDNTNYSYVWDFLTSSGDMVPDGDYTFKVSCNGKYCTKKLSLKTGR